MIEALVFQVYTQKFPLVGSMAKLVAPTMTPGTRSALPSGLRAYRSPDNL